MSKVSGNTGGLKARQIKRLDNVFKRRVHPDLLISPELARDLGELSREIRRQIGLLIDRTGRIHFVIVGDARSLVIPNLENYRYGPGRLKGLRLVHTHLAGEGVSEEDISDLVFLRLDLIAAYTLDERGLPEKFHVAHLMPGKEGDPPYRILEPFGAQDLDMGARDLIQELEGEIIASFSARKAWKNRDRALLVSVTTEGPKKARQSMAELVELAQSADLSVADTVIQHRKKADPKFLIGKGKLRDLAVAALHRGADLVIFDQELNPSQIRAVTDRIELPVIDRTQLILDIFAQRAMTREGRLQVELAQLKYMLPRLVGRNTALSRLAGGIGGRGPGETKLEIDRRRARERIRHLETQLDAVARRRQIQRSQRERKGLPVVSIVGYTNAGKSTLLNQMTKTEVLAESRMFATLDPASRRLRFPRDREVIITDTVGFIRDLPKDLVTAFKATLEELEGADLLLHVIDAANPMMAEQIKAVDRTLAELSLDRKETVRVLNKSDLMEHERAAALAERFEGVAVSALNPETLAPLMEKIEEILFQLG